MKVRSWLPALIPLVLVTALTELAVRFGFVRAYLVPAPSSILKAMLESRQELGASALHHLAQRAHRLRAQHRRRRGHRGFSFPPSCARHSTGVLSLRGVLSNGADHRHRAAAGHLVRLRHAHRRRVGLRRFHFPRSSPTRFSGILSTDPSLRDLFQLYGALHASHALQAPLPPPALPQILTGLRVASGLAVIGAIVGEFIGGQGLGSVVDVARTQQRVDKSSPPYYSPQY